MYRSTIENMNSHAAELGKQNAQVFGGHFARKTERVSEGSTAIEGVLTES